MVDKIAIEKLKSKTNIGDKFGVYYQGTTYKHTEEVVKKSDKSVWLKSSWMTSKGKVSNIHHESWNTMLKYINTKVYRKR